MSSNIFSDIFWSTESTGGSGTGDMLSTNNLSDVASVSTSRTNLGLGTIATQDSTNISVTGGSIVGIAPVSIASGGTAASNITDARANLGLGTLATLDSVSSTEIDTASVGLDELSATGTKDNTTFLRGDNTWATPAGSGGGDLVSTNNLSDVADVPTSRTNLDVYSKSETDALIPTTGTIASQDANNVTITGGSISGITDLAIADGGTGASTKTAAFDGLAPTTTKGDLVVSNGTNNVQLAVGTDDYVLTADSTAASGLKWAAGGSGGSSSAPAFSIVGNYNQDIANQANTTVQWSYYGELKDDPDSLLSGTYYTTFTAPSAGLYQFHASLMWNNPSLIAGNELHLLHRLNTTSQEFARFTAVAVASAYYVISGSFMLNLAANDTVEIQAWQNSGNTITTYGTYAQRWSGYKVR